MSEKEIELLNALILNAVIDGADSGGSYQNNPEGLYFAMFDILKYYNLFSQYNIVKVFVDRVGEKWFVYQFEKKGTE